MIGCTPYTHTRLKPCPRPPGPPHLFHGKVTPFDPNSCFLQRFPIISLMHLTITKVSASGFPPKARETISIFFFLFSQSLSSIQLQQTILLRLPQNYTSQFNARFHYYTCPGNMDTSFGVPYLCRISFLTAVSCYYFSDSDCYLL